MHAAKCAHSQVHCELSYIITYPPLPVLRRPYRCPLGNYRINFEYFCLRNIFLSMSYRFHLHMFTKSPFAAPKVCEDGVKSFVAGSVMGAQILFANRKSFVKGWVLTSSSVAMKFYECWAGDDGRSFACACAAGTDTFVVCFRLLPRKFLSPLMHQTVQVTCASTLLHLESA